ncbi:putative protein kinase [Plasmopara halstedii]
MMHRCYVRLLVVFISILARHLIPSHAMEPRKIINFTLEAETGSHLPVNDSFVFDGTTSDIARQLYLRHVAGDSIEKCVPNTIPSTVTARLAPFNISFENLPGLLQRALLWDSGFVISPENDAVQIWTLGGRSMANLAISRIEYHTTGCTALNCSQPNDRMYNANDNCTGTQILTAAKCLMDNFDSDTSSHVAMWSDGGDVTMIPNIRAVKHGWMETATNDSFLVYAVHTMKLDEEPAYGMCNTHGYGSLVVPCYPVSNTSADVVAVMSVPVFTPWVTTWIKQYQPKSNTSVNNKTDDSRFNMWLLGPIILGSLLVFLLLVFFVYKKRQRLPSIYMPRYSPAESDCSRKSKPPGPLVAPRQQENRTSLRRTEQETIGDFDRTLHLPGLNDSPIEEQSPILEETPPHSRRNTAPAFITSSLAARSSQLAAQLNALTSRRGSVPSAYTSMEEAQAPATTRATLQTLMPTARQASARRIVVRPRPSSSPAVRLSSAQESTYRRRPSSAQTFGRPSSAQTLSRPSSARSLRQSGLSLSRRSYSDVWSDRSSVQNQSGSHYLPTLRESISMSPIQNYMPSIRDSIQADLESIPALRETFSRYSAADNVQYKLTTDSNLVGKRIAWERIEVGPLLSRGAFGEVWACRYAGKKVAVKRLLQTKKLTFQETAKFINEIQLTASLKHPHIVRFIGVAWSSLENLAMVEEFLPRGDLQQFLKRSGDLMTWARDKVDMAIGIAKAIDYLHSRQVIHRDLKARNILLTKRLQPKLIDFGTSRVWKLNDMTAGIGTPFWTAPEVLESSKYTEKADIYSFGVLLSELDTCEAPYYDTFGTNGEKMKPFHVLKEVLDGTLRPSFTAGCPQRIRKAADDCFQHDPHSRPSAAELVRMLEG